MEKLFEQVVAECDCKVNQPRKERENKDRNGDNDGNNDESVLPLISP